MIICLGKNGGDLGCDSHTTEHRRKPMDVWHPLHFSPVRYCHIADTVSHAHGE